MELCGGGSVAGVVCLTYTCRNDVVGCIPRGEVTGGCHSLHTVLHAKRVELSAFFKYDPS